MLVDKPGPPDMRRGGRLMGATDGTRLIRAIL